MVSMPHPNNPNKMHKRIARVTNSRFSVNLYAVHAAPRELHRNSQANSESNKIFDFEVIRVLSMPHPNNSDKFTSDFLE